MHALHTGTSNLFVFHDPSGATHPPSSTPSPIEWGYAQAELASLKGLTAQAKNALNISAGMCRIITYRHTDVHLLVLVFVHNYVLTT